MPITYEQLECDVINKYLKKASEEEKSWFLQVVNLILDTFPNIDMYPAEKYIGFGSKSLNAKKVRELLIICHFERLEARFHINSDAEKAIYNSAGKEFHENIQFNEYNDIALVKPWLLFIEKQLGKDAKKYTGQGRLPIDYPPKLNANDKKQSLINSKAENHSMKNKKYPLNQILYGPPGTGKTFNTINNALEITDVDVEGKTREELKQLFNEKIKSEQIVFTTFHQSMCYEDFIEGIKPVIDEKENNIGYQIKDGIFKRLADKAKIGDVSKTISANEAIENFKKLCTEQKIRLYTSTEKAFDVEYHGNTTFRVYPEGSKHEDLGNGYPASIDHISEYILTGDLKAVYNSSYVKAIGEHIKNTTNIDTSKQEYAKKQNFVLIIDEINRGNVSQIFGELITLIEEDKRIGNAEELTVTLPYSKKPFGVPNNLYIIGTMNTADRSVEALDTALRRRFSFTEMLPKPELLSEDMDGINLKELLTTINQRIEYLLDSDHQIGHSYFISVSSLKDLCDVFNNKVVPLLQEYFFNNYAKIGLILGEGFVQQENQSITLANSTKFSIDANINFDEEKRHYKLIQIEETEISKAIKTLLG